MGQQIIKSDNQVTLEFKGNLEDSLMESFVDFTEHSTFIKNISLDNIFDTYRPDNSDAHDIIRQSFQNNSFISGETWENTISLQARVLNSNSLFVTCECLVDKENEILELRDFPRILFALLDLNSVEYVIIKLREKPGSSRIDIYEAKNMVDKSAFEIKDMWADLENSGVDQPIKQDD